MADTETRAEFMIAALVLIVMPVVFLLGLGSLIVFLLLLGIDPAGRVMIVGAAIWGLLVLIVLLVVAKRMTRRPAQP